MRITGIENFQKKLEKMAESIRKLQGKNSVKFDEIFHPIFMLENTSYGSIQEFFDASPFKIETQADFESVDPNLLDVFVREKT